MALVFKSNIVTNLMLKRSIGLMHNKILREIMPRNAGSESKARLQVKHFHRNVKNCNPRQPPQKKDTISPANAMKYQVISDNATQTDSIEHMEYSYDKYPILSDEFDGVNLERGKTGVFEIEDLVQLLHRENARNVFVATVPQHINYVDYICIVSGRSKRHILAIAEFVRKVYKKKCNKHDPIPKIEGAGSDEWMALDLGNIALHIFSEKTREVYDLETLWAVGREFDDQTSKKSEVLEIFESYSDYLKDLKPLS